jgi:hypothetical protein
MRWYHVVVTVLLALNFFGNLRKVWASTLLEGVGYLIGVVGYVGLMVFSLYAAGFWN